MKEIKTQLKLIDGVTVTPLKTIPDERGAILHGGKQTEFSTPFQEVYFKKLFYDVVNGWHVHETMELNYTCIFGYLKLVLCDLRETSETYGNIEEHFIGNDRHVRVHIPTGVANASQCINGDFAIFANFASKEHDPSLKYLRLDPFDGPIRYDWNNKHF